VVEVEVELGEVLELGVETTERKSEVCGVVLSKLSQVGKR